VPGRLVLDTHYGMGGRVGEQIRTASFSSTP